MGQLEDGSTTGSAGKCHRLVPFAQEEVLNSNLVTSTRRTAFYIQVRAWPTYIALRSRSQPPFVAQAPFFVFAMVVVALKVNIKLSDEIESQSLAQKVKKIDFVGSFTLVGSVGCMLLGVSLKAAEEISWSSPTVVGLFFASAIFTATFVLSQKYWASYPVMPLRLISQRTPLAVSMANLFASMSAFSMVSFCYLFFTHSLSPIPSCITHLWQVSQLLRHSCII